jgi:hypothetical protein
VKLNSEKRALAVQTGAQEIRWRDAPAIARRCLATLQSQCQKENNEA